MTSKLLVVSNYAYIWYTPQLCLNSSGLDCTPRTLDFSLNKLAWNLSLLGDLATW